MLKCIKKTANYNVGDVIPFTKNFNPEYFEVEALELYNIFFENGQFSGTLYSSEDLRAVHSIFYQLGITYYTEGDYATGVLITSTL